MKYPIKCVVHDFSGSRRGQGKRRGSMIMGAMSARTGKSLTIDMAATFGISGDDLAEVECMNQWEFNTYHRLREEGMDHGAAAKGAFLEPEEA